MPIRFGYIVARTGSFIGALVFVSLNALLAIGGYLFIVARLECMQLHLPARPAHA